LSIALILPQQIVLTWTLKVAKAKQDVIPIEIKKQGKPLFPLFPYGVQAFQSFLLKSHKAMGRFSKQLLRFSFAHCLSFSWEPST
jgi:hypothetical protein